MPFRYDHPRPAVTVEVVLFTMRAEDLAVLLVKRGAAPFKGHWALPGGAVNEREPLDYAAARELAEETGITGITMEQLGAFGDPGRDPRGHAVSIVYLTFVVAESHRVVRRAGEAAWIPLSELPLPDAKPTHKLAFDHANLITRARVRLQERMNDPTPKNVFELVPQRFTLTELQRVYEAVFGRPLDKRNFRARLLSRGLVEPVSAARRTGRHRPAQLYRWRQPKQGR